MEITEVKVFPIQEEKLKAFVSIVFDQCFMVNDIKIIQGRDGLFISMPSRKKKNGEFKDVAHPLNNETRRMIEDRVLGEYQRVLSERGEALPAPPARPHAGSAAVSAAAAPASPAMPAMLAAGAELQAFQPGEPGAGNHGGAGAAPGAATSPARPESPEARETPGIMGEKSLEEIEEMHLRDSFWTS